MVAKDVDLVIWQEVEDMPEPAVTLKFYGNVIELCQEGRYINLNYETVPLLCRELKKAKPSK